jgi:HlyD family secretion protein
MKSGFVPKSDLDAKRESFELAKVALAKAQQDRELTRRGRVDTGTVKMESIIRAPAAGTVLSRAVNPGEPVVPLTSFQPGTEMATIADMSDLIFKGTVDEIDVGKLHEGMPAHIKVGALPDAKVEGRIYKISPKSKTAEGATLFDVEIELLPAKDVVLRAGYSANAEIAVREKHGVLVIPERLVSFADGKASVELPGKAAKDPPLKKEIKTGLSDGMQVEVAEGLSEKDLVIERPPKKIE